MAAKRGDRIEVQMGALTYITSSRPLSYLYSTNRAKMKIYQLWACDLYPHRNPLKTPAAQNVVQDFSAST